MKALILWFVLAVAALPLTAGETINYGPTAAGAEAERIKRAQKAGVHIGMTASQCMDALGRPDEINRTITANGKTEQWVYGNKYLYLDNGVLTAIQN